MYPENYLDTKKRISKKAAQMNTINNPNSFRKEIIEGISLFTAVKNRTKFLEESLITWIAHNDIDEIIIVDWDSEESLLPIVNKYQNGKITLFVVRDQPRWILSFAFNLAASLTTRTRILKVDADIKLSKDFFTNHPLKPGNFYSGNWEMARNDNERHLHGTYFGWREDFFRVNGYNEFIKSYGWDDIDLYDRLESLPLKHLDLNQDCLSHTPHENRTINQNQLSDFKNINDSEKSLVNALINKYLSTIYKPWTVDEKPISFIIEKVDDHLFNCVSNKDLNIVPVEIMQKCEMHAIMHRLRERNMALPESLLQILSRDEFVLLFNLFSQDDNLTRYPNYHELITKIIKNTNNQSTDAQDLITNEIASLKSTLADCEKNLAFQKQQINLIKESYSWRFGHSFFSFVDLAIKPAKILKKETLNRWAPPKKINMSAQIGDYYGKHRSGWSYAVAGLADLHNPEGVILDSFVERTFGWHPDGVKPHRSPWIGFIHVPPIVPVWFMSEMSNENIFTLPQWKESLSFCKGIFTLTSYHKKNLEKILPVPVNNLLHPTETPEIQWNWQKFISNKEKKIIQIGYWLRKLYSIHLLDAQSFKKVFIVKDDTSMDYLLKAEKENYSLKNHLTEEALQSVKLLPFQTNHDYDLLLSNNIIYLDLYDSSANNAIIECIVRNTPVLVNPIEPVIEYLGVDYPFYFTDHLEAAEKLQNFDLIKDTHEYLKDHPVKKKLSLRYFRKSFIESSVYQNL
jgi:hypothetical protein